MMSPGSLPIRGILPAARNRTPMAIMTMPSPMNNFPICGIPSVIVYWFSKKYAGYPEGFRDCGYTFFLPTTYYLLPLVADKRAEELVVHSPQIFAHNDCDFFYKVQGECAIFFHHPVDVFLRNEKEIGVFEGHG